MYSSAFLTIIFSIHSLGIYIYTTGGRGNRAYRSVTRFCDRYRCPRRFGSGLLDDRVRFGTSSKRLATARRKKRRSKNCRLSYRAILFTQKCWTQLILLSIVYTNGTRTADTVWKMSGSRRHRGIPKHYHGG